MCAARPATDGLAYPGTLCVPAEAATAVPSFAHLTLYNPSRAEALSRDKKHPRETCTQSVPIYIYISAAQKTTHKTAPRLHIVHTYIPCTACKLSPLPFYICVIYNGPPVYGGGRNPFKGRQRSWPGVLRSFVKNLCARLVALRLRPNMTPGNGLSRSTAVCGTLADLYAAA